MIEQADEHRTALCVQLCEGIPASGLEMIVAGGVTLQDIVLRQLARLLTFFPVDKVDTALPALPRDGDKIRRLMREL